ncbi:MAG: 2-oxoglutarate dehydrogenase complex dihydrolipoyllysine-residue succinyltransferase [Desulfobacteraceae bacterium]|jgi:2-oxoglutarate dehydrogenase E2 component (dihydrolipoamide succinyltransferase)|nr:2-oxoglutarate dehydrogenase complex dihydrolipoyllysine-residue succinyltransferase [Desulfobacteraceae bacterium]
MKLDIKIPNVGESVKEALLAEWYKKDGEHVKKDDVLLVIETDKVTLEVTAEADGVLHISVPAGKTVAIGDVVGAIDTEGAPAEKEEKPAKPAPEAKEEVPEEAKEKKAEPPAAKTPEKPAPAADLPEDRALSPAVRRLVREKGIDPKLVKGTGPGGRITKGDVLLHLEQAPAGVPEACEAPTAAEAAEPVVRKAMSPIRRRIADRLLAAKQSTAMLTTFNEIDMRAAMEMRSRYKEDFQARHDVGLGFMSFFTAACVAALKEIPEINAFIEGDEIVYHNYQHIGIAIGSPRGLVVPVIRHCERLSFAGIERAIVAYVAKIKENRLELADLEGGTFTISNGGVYGSLLSTPILNTPQSAILGMHKIEKRAVVVDDEIVIRPMMYVALSYDHRIVDGKGAVTFLKRVKEMVENPERILMEV